MPVTQIVKFFGNTVDFETWYRNTHSNSRTRMWTLSRDLTHQLGNIMADNDWQQAAGSATRN